MSERKLYKSGFKRRFRKFIRKVGLFNRRKGDRFTSFCSIECMCIYKESGRQIECSPYIKDISKGGLLLMTNENKIYPDTQVEIRVKLPNRQEAVSVQGKIVRTYRRETGVWYYSGVEFQNKKDKNIQLLLDFVRGE